MYLKPNDSVGAVTVSGAIDFAPRYPRSSQQVLLSKIYITASEEEDITIGKLGVRITNYVAGQFKNVKLIGPDNKQFGATISNPVVVDYEYPNALFSGQLTVLAGQTVELGLFSDVSIPSSSKSEYGTSLQREIMISIYDGKDSNRWITATGNKSASPVRAFGAVDTWLEFSE